MTRDASPSLDVQVRAGVAVYNDGYRHAAHDAWEETWLDLDDGDDERFLHGLIQFTAAVYHAHDANWPGATGLAESAQDYLADLPDEYRNVDVAGVRNALVALASDPEVVERRQAPVLRYDGDALRLPDLDVDAALVAAPLVADATGLDADTVADGVEYARRDIERGEGTSQFVTLAADVARETEHRAVVAQRLDQHVQRRRRKERDVEGLFD